MKIKEKDLKVLVQCTISEDGRDLKLPDINLDRKLYVSVNKVLTSLGYKWNRGKKLHINKEDVSEKFYNMLDTGEWLDVKKELQYFPTPQIIVDKMINKVEWRHGMTVLEPSVGTGNILTSIPQRDLLVDAVEINKDFIDKIPKTFPTQEKDMKNHHTIFNQDFMKFNSIRYDVILANPPFSKLQDIKHFYRMVGMLAKGGTLVCILSAGSYDKDSGIKLRREFTEFVEKSCIIENIDEGAFKESGTNIRTIMVTYKNT